MNNFLKGSILTLNCLRSYSSRPFISQVPNLLDIGCRPIFNEDHDILRTNIRRFVQEEIMPNHSKWEEEGQVSRDLWKKAGENGLLGINIAEKDHGLGGDVLSTAVVWEELAYGNCSGPGFSLHSDIVMPYISYYGSQEQKDRYLPKMTQGECIGAIAMTEPGAGSDLQGIKTKAKKDGDDWILSGSKTFITNGWLSDLVVVVSLTDPGAKSAAHGISLFLVDAGTPGFVKGSKLKKMGLKAQDTAELFFEDVRLPKSQLLGEVNKGFVYLMKELPRERLLIADMCQALMEFVFEETRAHVRQRKAFKSTLSNLQTVQHKLAEMKTTICSSRSFVDDCLLLLNGNKLDTQTASMAKYHTSELLNRICYDGVQLHGGWGYMWDYPICKTYVDARVQSIYGGANEIMKELIARSIVKD